MIDNNTKLPFVTAMTSITYKLLVNLGLSDILITCLCGTVNVIQTYILGKYQYYMRTMSPEAWSTNHCIAQWLRSGYSRATVVCGKKRQKAFCLAYEYSTQYWKFDKFTIDVNGLLFRALAFRKNVMLCTDVPSRVECLCQLLHFGCHQLWKVSCQYLCAHVISKADARWIDLQE